MSLSRINFKLCIGVFYRPPSSSAVIFDLLCDSLSQHVYQSYFSNFVIVGDFNVDFTTSILTLCMLTSLTLWLVSASLRL